MKITNKTILITGGGSGIGFEIARLLTEKGNRVIIAGRNEKRLALAAEQLKLSGFITADITKEEDVSQLVSRLLKEYGNPDILINNAGSAFAYHLSAEAGAFEKASSEILTNYLSVIRLTEKLLPNLQQQQEAAIVNVSSIVAFAPNSFISTYSASKAALHSYTQSLRGTLAKTTAVKVFELMPPLVDTEFSQEIGGANGIAPAVVAEQLFAGLENDTFEIHVGNTAQLYQLFLSSPQEAFNMLNQEA